MEKEELMRMFNENVAYLERNIPPDDIYPFTEQTFMAAVYFLHRWSKHEDINSVCEENLVARKWVQNIMSLKRLRDMKQDVSLDLSLDIEDECD